MAEHYTCDRCGEVMKEVTRDWVTLKTLRGTPSYEHFDLCPNCMSVFMAGVKDIMANNTNQQEA